MQPRSDHPCYRDQRRRESETNRHQARRVLRAGLWFWPRDADEEAFDFAKRVQGGEVERPQPGETPLLAYQERPEGRDAGAVLLLEAPVRGGLLPGLIQGSGEGRQLQSLESAEDAWARACQAVCQTIPVLWKTTDDLMEWKPRTRFVGGGVRCSEVTQVDGLSYGLPFAMAAASRLLDLPLPVEVAATGAVTEEGDVESVDGLEAKLKTLHHMAPRVDWVLVAAEDEEVAQGVVDECELGLRVHGISRVSELFEAPPIQLFPDPESLIEKNLTEPEWGDEVFRLGFGRRDSILCWEPVARAAQLAQTFQPEERWPEGAWRLEFTEAVARRHSGDWAELPIPERDWLGALQISQRREILAHLVQQSANCATPAPETIREWAMESIGREKEADEAALKVLGAVGRLDYVGGEFELAAKFQKESLGGWWRLRRLDEMSYGLSFLYLLAGVRRRDDWYEQATNFERKWRGAASGALSGVEWVAVAKGRALVQLGRTGEGGELLGGFLQHGLAGGIVALRNRARRWLLEARERQGEAPPGEVSSWVTDLKERAEDELPAKREYSLVSLGRTLRAGDRESAAEHARAFLDTRPQSIERLLKNLEVSEQEKPAAIFRYYQY